MLTDEQREFVGSLSLDRLPALVHIGQDGSLVGCAKVGIHQSGNRS